MGNVCVCAEAVGDGFHLHVVQVEVGESQKGDVVGEHFETPIFVAVLVLMCIVGDGCCRLWRVTLQLIAFQERRFNTGAVGESEVHRMIPVAILQPPVCEHLDRSA